MLKKKVLWSKIILVSLVAMTTLIAITAFFFFKNFSELQEELRSVLMWAGGSMFSILSVIGSIYGKLNSDKKDFEKGLDNMREISRIEREDMLWFKSKLSIFNHFPLTNVPSPYKETLQEVLKRIEKSDEGFSDAVIEQFCK